MFTVKHYRADGRLWVGAAETFEHDPEKDRNTVHLNRPDLDLEIDPADRVFIENQSGKTIYAIRPPRIEEDA